MFPTHPRLPSPFIPHSFPTAFPTAFPPHVCVWNLWFEHVLIRIRAIRHTWFFNSIKTDIPHKAIVGDAVVNAVVNAVGNEWGMDGTYCVGSVGPHTFGCHNGRPMAGYWPPTNRGET